MCEKLIPGEVGVSQAVSVELFAGLHWGNVHILPILTWLDLAVFCFFFPPMFAHFWVLAGKLAWYFGLKTVWTRFSFGWIMGLTGAHFHICWFIRIHYWKQNWTVLLVEWLFAFICSFGWTLILLLGAFSFAFVRINEIRSNPLDTCT